MYFPNYHTNIDFASILVCLKVGLDCYALAACWVVSSHVMCTEFSNLRGQGTRTKGFVVRTDKVVGAVRTVSLLVQQRRSAQQSLIA